MVEDGGMQESTPVDRARRLDEADPLTAFRSRFLAVPEVVAYLDGNSLGRPLDRTPDRLADLARDRWGGRLIRGWDEGWMEEPQRLGDELGRVVLGGSTRRTR
jgi:kynureninase